MGHYICSYNKAGDEIAFAHFSMGNFNALLLYRLLDSMDYNAGVSGTGDSSKFIKQQFEKALHELNQLINKHVSANSDRDSLDWDQKQILNFLEKCLDLAEVEESVRVCFC